MTSSWRPSRPRARRARLLQLPVLAVAAALVLTACSSSADDDPTISAPTTAPPSATPTSQTGATPTASATVAATGYHDVLSAWKSCSDGFQCATLTVPLDAADSALGTVALSLTRHKATGSSSQRIGSLVVNPGGPGASAVDYLQSAYTDLPSTVRKHFDLVAFDPRGVGHTSPVTCESTSQLDAYFHLDPAPTTEAGLKALDAANTTFAKGCESRSSRILPYVSTKVVAQDLDRVRAAVGDQKLSYLGYSYGTAIGSEYLRQFPTHVRAMVLDGVLDPTLTWNQLLAGQSMGFDVALNAFLANCQQTTCAFRKAVSGDLQTAYDALQKQVAAHPLPGDGSRTVGVAEFSTGVLAGLYSKAYGWPAIAQALSQAKDGDGKTLLALNDSYLERTSSGYSNILQANAAVNCVDRPWPRSDAPYVALAKQVGKSYPRFGPSIALSGIGCSVWPLPAVTTPSPVSAVGSPTVLVIGTTRDPATPYVWSQSLVKQLAHGVLLTHNGDGHTVYRIGAPDCVLDPVDDYLVELTQPKTSTC